MNALTSDGTFVVVGDAVFDDAIISFNKSASSSSFSQFSCNVSALVFLPFSDAIDADIVPRLMTTTLTTIADENRTILLLQIEKF